MNYLIIYLASLWNVDLNSISNSGHVWDKIVEFNFHGQHQIKKEEDHELHSFHLDTICVTFLFWLFWNLWVCDNNKRWKVIPKWLHTFLVPSYPIGILHSNLLNYLHTIMQNIWFETMRYVPHTFKKYLKLSWSIIYINIGYVYLFLFIF